MLDHWLWITEFLKLSLAQLGKGIMDGLSLNVGQFWNPMTDEVAIRIKLLALELWIEDSEVRTGIYISRSAPAGFHYI